MKGWKSRVLVGEAPQFIVAALGNIVRNDLEHCFSEANCRRATRGMVLFERQTLTLVLVDGQNANLFDLLDLPTALSPLEPRAGTCL